MQVKNLRLDEYDYELDDERIAKFPLAQRDGSKLLVYKNGDISTSTFNSIPNLLNDKPTLVFNNTKVIRARMRFRKSTGAGIEVFLLNPVSPISYPEAFESTNGCRWNCVVGNLKKWKGETLLLPIDSLRITLKASMVNRSSDGAYVEFDWDHKANISFAEIVDAIGQVPLPPYLNREPVYADAHTYQTVYAEKNGSVAAPTAGLHFTDRILSKLKSSNCLFTNVTLHVGAGTFKPVKSAVIGDHGMHCERIHVSKESLEEIRANLGHIVAVGTTSLRTLESLYWLGVKVILGKYEMNALMVEQWDPYSLDGNYKPLEALNALMGYMDQMGIEYISAVTQLIIVPGYLFRVVNRLITNFHQPKSTLLLLVAAFIGDDWKKVYQYALENDFRFLSYGDSSILFGKEDANTLANG